MPRWPTKGKGNEVEGETPLEDTEEETQQQNEPEMDQALVTKVHEVEYRLDSGMRWAYDLSGAINRAIEDRTNLIVRERDLDELRFYLMVLAHVDSRTIAKAELEQEREEHAKVENDMNVS